MVIDDFMNLLKFLQGANIPASVSIADMIEFGPCLS